MSKRPQRTQPLQMAAAPVRPTQIEPTEDLPLTMKERQALTTLLDRGVSDTLYNRTAAIYKSMLRKLDRISRGKSATAERLLGAAPAPVMQRVLPVLNGAQLPVVPPRPSKPAKEAKSVFRNVPVDISAAVRAMDAVLKPPAERTEVARITRSADVGRGMTAALAIGAARDLGSQSRALIIPDRASAPKKAADRPTPLPELNAYFSIGAPADTRPIVSNTEKVAPKKAAAKKPRRGAEPLSRVYSR